MVTNPSSKSTDNGSSTLPPSSSKSSPHMTMNGNKPPPQEQNKSDLKKSVSSDQSSNIANPNNVNAKQRRHNKSRGANEDNVGLSIGLSGGSPTDNDAAYCTEIARRSVARAALHLGMEGMEGEALDSLGSILLGYMEMVGTTISSNVEASGRSSAHSNAYDALNAIEDCTAPAAAQLGSVSSNFSTQSEISQQLKLSGDHSKIKEIVQERGWEGLASFIFGPDWFSIPLEGEEEAGPGRPKVQQKDDKIQTNGTAIVKKAPGGKQILPARPPNSNNSTAISMASPKSGKGKQLSNMSATKERERSVSFSLDRQPSSSVVGTDGGGTDTTVPSATNNRGGPITNDSDEGATSGRWHAPYLNTIPSFPLVSSDTNIANHRLSESKVSMHDLATEMEACRETNTAHYIKRQHSSESSSKKVHPSTAKKEQRLKVEMAEKKMREALRFSDDIYTSKPGIVWGSIKDSNTANNNEKELVGKKSATEATKVKFDPSSTKPSSAPIIRAPYVPNFLPPFPTDEYSDLAQVKLAASMSTESIMGDVMTRIHHRGQKRKASETNLSSDSEMKEMNDVTERDSVRRSVIGLGKSVGPSYWGSNWLDNDSGDAKRASNNNTISLSGVTVAAGEKGGASTKKSSSDASQVLPLVRPSGSRLSKILEGSMT